MICRVGDERRTGRAIDLDGRVPPETLAAAIRQEGQVTPQDGPTVAVTTRRSGPVHEHVGCLTPTHSLRIPTALAAAGRARGLRTPHDPEIADLQAALDRRAPESSTDGETLAAHREAVAEATASRERHRERVAAARGQVEARREADRDPAPATDTLETAAADLADAETAAVAARQRHERDRRAARAHRDRLEANFHLADELANRRRAARATLVDRLRPAYAAALRDLPGLDPPADPFDADPVAAGLAIARVAGPNAPIVLAADHFPDAEAAAAWLGSPVIRVRV